MFVDEFIQWENNTPRCSNSRLVLCTPARRRRELAVTVRGYSERNSKYAFSSNERFYLYQGLPN